MRDAHLKTSKVKIAHNGTGRCTVPPTELAAAPPRATAASTDTGGVERREDGPERRADDSRHCDTCASHNSCAGGALVTPRGPAGAMASTMQLEFTQAMTDFKTMFPDMDDDVIEAVLRANQGAVDATIDQLLAMSTDNQNERLRLEMERVEGCSPARRLRRAARPRLASAAHSDTTALVDIDDESIPLAVRRKWVPRMLGPLPPTFLRIPAGADARIDLSLDMDDDRIATFLQNEEFMAELRWNQEFMAALDSEQGKTKGHDDEAAFKERLKNMGKLSRKKFAQLSRMFSRGAPRRAGGARAPPRGPPDSLLLQEEHSDDEDRHHKV